MHLYTIYHKPLDYPDNYVVRKFLIGPKSVVPSSEIYICNTLDEARDSIPYGLFKITRSEDDNPSVVETWM